MVMRAPWIMHQSWTRQLFAHWPVEVEQLRALAPPALPLDLFEGRAYVGLTPFHLALRFRWLPPMPTASAFPEMNLRTYVTVGGKPGVFFFSLDAASTLAVITARATFHLPYVKADMSIESSGEWISYRSRRRSAPAELIARYRPTGPAYEAAPGSLDHFLTERYALYVVTGSGTVLRGDVHHRPWQLHPAEAVIERDTVAAAHGITLPPLAPILHYSHQQDTLIWPPTAA
jgi:uncharacterized protein YqjF (DUF2071 family)